MKGLTLKRVCRASRRNSLPGSLSFLARVLVFAAAASLASGALAQQRFALLVGVGQYERRPLEGPPHDVEALRSVLTQRWGFAPQSVKVLVDQAATKAAVLSSLDDLVGQAKAGDSVFFYFSGHGTSALDATSARHGLTLPQSSGALVAYDAINAKGIRAERLIIGRTDLRPRLTALDAKGVHVLVIADACYSGQTVRGAGRETQGIVSLPRRYLAESAGQSALSTDMAAALALGSVPTVEPYPYQNVVYLSAASQGEEALDINMENMPLVPTLDQKPHGTLTDSVLRVLYNQLGVDTDGDGRLTYRKLQTAVTGFMADRGFAHSPQLLPSVVEDTQGLATRSVFGMDRASTGEPLRRPAVLAARLRVYTSYDNAALMAALAKVPGIQRVDQRGQADLIMVESTPGVLAFRTPSDDTITSIKASDLSALTSTLAGYSAAQRLRSLAQQGQRAGLPFEVNPAHFGGNFVFGQKLNFVVRPDRKATLVVLNLDANGKWTTLYPASSAEHGALALGKAYFIPGQTEQLLIQVGPPEGMDSVFAFAFDKPPPALNEITGLNQTNLQDPRMERFVEGLAKLSGQYTFARVELRALPLPQKP